MTWRSGLDPLRISPSCGPVIEGISTALGNGVDWLISHSLLPLASLIIEPAKVLFCLATTSSSYTVLQEADRVAIHILGQDQEDIARRFATSGLTGTHKLEGTGWTPGPDGVPLIPGTPAVLAGRVDQAISSGDHIIFLIDVDHVGLKESATPALSFYRGRFASPATAVPE